MMTRALTAIALLLAAGACSREAQKNASNGANQTGAVNSPAPAPAPAPPPASANLATQAETEEQEQEAGTEDEQEPEPAPTPEPEARQGCAGEIGPARARELALQCRDVSPATRPPCNVANSCEMIQSEIERGCELLGEDAPPFCVPR
jgi:hypothetical protein